MIQDGKIWIGQSAEGPVYILPEMLNRHGLIAGATGTGKTVTLKVLTEALSELGIPVFLADIKGDVSGLGAAGVPSENVSSRVEKFGVTDFAYKGFPVDFWDVYGEFGHPVRTTISEMGSQLLGKLLGLNETQTSVLHIVFRIADDQGLLLLDMKDLRAMLQHVADENKTYAPTYGNIASQSIGAIIRAVVVLEGQGGDIFFGEPALDLSDWMHTNSEGKGMINILHSVKLYQEPALYATFLLWMLSELFELLPEVGDLPKPKMVFVFDEAHLLFKDTPKALVEKVEQVVRLIRSKGVGVYFVTQTPGDLPQSVLGQLGNKIQHALRAFTPAEQKQIKASAQSFRENPALDTETVLTELGTGEALVSCLNEDGQPEIVQRAFILPPQSMFEMLTEEQRRLAINTSQFALKYMQEVDRESAYEMLAKKAEEQAIADAAEELRIQEEKAAAQAAKEEAKKKSKKTPLEKSVDTLFSTAISLNFCGISSV